MGITNFDVVQASAFIGGSTFLTQGKTWFVKPYTGLDGGGRGVSPQKAFKTLAAALAAARAGQNDVIYLFAESDTAANTSDYQTATLNWNKDLVHLIGVNAGPALSQRSRVAFLSTYATASNLFTLSANGCLIANIEFFAGVASANPTGCVKVTGERNHFVNCHIAGMGNTANDIAGAYSLYLNGCQENLFERCSIGLDTVAAGAGGANSEILVDGAATRNKFVDSLIYRLIGHTSQHPLVKLSDAVSIDRWLWFRRCLFLSESVNYAIAQTGVMLVPALTQGYIIVENCSANSANDTGPVKWDANDNNKIVLFDQALTPADTAGTERMV